MRFGNFISAQTQAHTKDNAILNIQITKNGATGEISIDKIDYTPVYVYDKGASVKNRYELIDIREAMLSYESGDTSKVGAGLYNTLKKEIADIEKVLGKNGIFSLLPVIEKRNDNSRRHRRSILTKKCMCIREIHRLRHHGEEHQNFKDSKTQQRLFTQQIKRNHQHDAADIPFRFDQQTESHEPCDCKEPQRQLPLTVQDNQRQQSEKQCHQNAPLKKQCFDRAVFRKQRMRNLRDERADQQPQRIFFL